MKSLKLAVVVCLLAAVGFWPGQQASLLAQENPGAVFVMTNSANGNQIESYARHADGSLQWIASFATGGNGSGGTIDPLHSQGSLILSQDHRHLFAVNAGSGTISSFRVDGTFSRSSTRQIAEAPSLQHWPRAVTCSTSSTLAATEM